MKWYKVLGKTTNSINLPDTIVWIIFAVCIAPKPLPRQPAHGRCPGEPIIQTHPHSSQAEQGHTHVLHLKHDTLIDVLHYHHIFLFGTTYTHVTIFFLLVQ